MRWWILFLALALFGAGIETKIKKSQQRLMVTKKRIQGVNVKLSHLAKNIASLQKQLAKIDDELTSLNADIEKLDTELGKKKEEYEAIAKQIEKLSTTNKQLKADLVLLISKVFSKSLLLASMKNPTPEDIIYEESLKAIQKNENRKLQKVSKAFSATTQKLERSRKRLEALHEELQELLQKKSELKRLKLQQKSKLASLKKEKRRYDATLQSLIEQQNALNMTLKRLRIVQQRRRGAQSSKVRVKKYGQSYGKLRTVRYRGPKTIPPIEKFIIVKRYGVYKDPIYNIEIPNENIELKPLVPNAKVRNVLNGRIILAKWTPHLKNVVIIKHRNGLYTIYAYLDQLAPYVKRGRKVKKGYTIGRVNTKLIFEVTKNSAHINPLDLIKIK